MKTIIATGLTSGIGLAAAGRIQSESGVRLIVGARCPRSPEVLPLDLARLSSVRTFAAAVDMRLSGSPIDGLLLNAGVQFGNVKQRTEDGFETTFAVNHLAHYLLLRLLLPRLASGAVVVITTSNLHDPNTNPIAPPEHADAMQLMRGKIENGDTQSLRAGMRAYAASKLCNLLTARALSRSAVSRQRGLTVIAFNPGFTPGTELTRGQSSAFRLPFAIAVPILGFFQRMNTVEGGGNLLAGMALARVEPPAGHFYASQVRRQLIWPDPSALANDDAVMVKLWRDSAAIVGLASTDESDVL
ncbi:MAG TPA: SDR family NAD(P)-dependent oxidoreductase [Rhodanobacter sp.]